MEKTERDDNENVDISQLGKRMEGVEGFFFCYFLILVTYFLKVS